MPSMVRSNGREEKVRSQWALRNVLCVAVVASVTTLAAALQADEPAGQPAAPKSTVNGVVRHDVGTEGTRLARRHQGRRLAKESVAIAHVESQVVSASPNAQLRTRRLTESGLSSALQGARFGQAWGTNLNSPVVEGATMVTPASQARPARRHNARQLSSKAVVVDDADPRISELTRKSQSAPRTRSSLTSALQDPRFAETGWFYPRLPAPKPSGMGCQPWGCGMNSPVVEGAAMVTPRSQARPARRHQAGQMVHTDVVLADAGAEARRNRTVDSQNVRSALRDARFGEAHTSIAGSLKKGQQVARHETKCW